MISFPCPACSRKLTVKDEFAGKSGTCPHCKQRMKVPAAASAEADTLGIAQEAPPAPAFGGQGLDFLAPPQGPGELGRLGPYRVLKVLGAGGMGMVLMAEDPMLKRSVALKVMRPELAAREDARKRFLREAQATAAIEHTHIIPIYQVGEDRGVPFIAMPFLKGEALDARLKRECRGEVTSPLPVAEAVRLGRQIAEGLAAAHRNGLIHRDIKPANIWLERQEDDAGPAAWGWVKILDFGLARAAADDDGQLTKTGAILGTPAYMAPEQARSEKVDARCDLFSLGAVLYRMLTGQAPFKGSDPISLLAALALDTPLPVQELNPAIPAPLAELVMQMLAKAPADRPPSARAVADVLTAIETDATQALEPSSRPTAPAKPAGKRLPRWLLAAGGGGVLLGLVVLVLLYVLRPVSPVPAPPSTPAPDTDITNTIGMKLVRIEPGKFLMGSPPDEPGRQNDEDLHEVTIAKPFYLGACPVTVGQFKAFVQETKYQTDAESTGEGSGPLKAPPGKWQWDPRLTWRTPSFVQADDEPVVCVSWADAMAFCAWLSKKEGKPYALPSEAQWEYACRTGSQTPLPFGDEKEADQYAWFGANSGGKTQPVGRKKPNAWGLYDMEGNVYELTADWYGKDYYSFSPAQDPPGAGGPTPFPERGGNWIRGAFVARGHDYRGAAANLRAARRAPTFFASRDPALGFRVALLPKQTMTNSIGMKLAWIPPGKFVMGSPPTEAGRHPDETPHEISITLPFYAGVYNVTVGQFKVFVNETKYQTQAEQNGAGSYVGAPMGAWTLVPMLDWQHPGYEQTDSDPVVCVSWNDARKFCAWLSKKEGRGYALATEAQWEYACRAGSQTRFFFGDDEQQLADYGWYKANSDGKMHPVGQKKPNAWGLCDMHGLVWEWTADWYDKDYYGTSPAEDPPGPGGGETRVLRGGSGTRSAVDCRSAIRDGGQVPSFRGPRIGFRVALLP